ncbi:hypothetical protein FXO37_13765 [Capsicum annuum]|nr:hypothetical protein FXO37_13765 [Capsicum annuum]
MENLLNESREQVCDAEICKKLAKMFTRSKGRAGKPIVKWTEVQAWFQNRLACDLSKDNSAEANQKLPDITEGCSLNKANESSHIPKEMYKYSADKHFAGQKDPVLSDLEFEARSSKDGAWCDNSWLSVLSAFCVRHVVSCIGVNFEMRVLVITLGCIFDYMVMRIHAPSLLGVSWMFGNGERYDIDTFFSHRFLNTEQPEALVRFVGFEPGEDEWVNVRKAIRERSVALEDSECNKVRVGDLILCFQEGKNQAKYLEAHVIEIQKRFHDIRGCRCLFGIRYTCDDTKWLLPLDPRVVWYEHIYLSKAGKQIDTKVGSCKYHVAPGNFAPPGLKTKYVSTTIVDEAIRATTIVDEASLSKSYANTFQIHIPAEAIVP